MATATVCYKAVALLSFIHCLLLQLCGSWCCILVLVSGCIMPSFASDHLMHVKRCLLDFGCAIAVVNVIIVFM